MYVLRHVPALVLLLAAFSAAFAACDFGDGGSLYDPDAQDGPAPVIDGITPGGVVLAGIDEVTITGRNFSAVPDENTVFFDDGAGAAETGTVLEASETTLRVKVPNLPNPALRIRVAVRGAGNFSNAVAQPLTPAVVPFGNLDAGIGEEVFGVAPDGAGGLYASLFVDGSPVGIRRFAADGARTAYYDDDDFVWSGLALAPDGTLYGARRVRAVFEIPGGGPARAFARFTPDVTIAKVAAGGGGNLYAGGTNTEPADAQLYHVRLDGTASGVPFPRTVRDLAVFDGALYVAAVEDGASRVWRVPIGADGALDTPAPYFEPAAGTSILALAFATDGTLFVGTGAEEDPVLAVVPGGGSASTLYPGVLEGPASAFAWGAGSKLYVARASRVVNEEVVPAALVEIETRRQGAPNG